MKFIKWLAWLWALSISKAFFFSYQPLGAVCVYCLHGDLHFHHIQSRTMLKI